MDLHNHIWKDNQNLIGKLSGISIVLCSRIVYFIFSENGRRQRSKGLSYLYWNFASYNIFLKALVVKTIFIANIPNNIYSNTLKSRKI